MMPLVTVSDRPSGAPTATTVCPTDSELDLAKIAAVRLASPSTLITARSSGESRPTIFALALRPSARVTLIFPPLAPTETT